MAKKFNNGQTFGEIRKILNDNADDINTNATATANAMTAAKQLAGHSSSGRVKSSQGYSNAFNSTIYINSLTSDAIKAAWDQYVAKGDKIYTDGIALTKTICFRFNTIMNWNDLSYFLNYPLMYSLSGWRNLTAVQSFIVVIEEYFNNVPEGPFYGSSQPVFSLEEPLSCCTFGSVTLFNWRNVTGFCYIREDGTSWYSVGSSEYKLPVATTSVLGGVKQGENTNIDKNGVISVTLANAGENTNAGVVSEGAIPFQGATPEDIYNYGSITWRNGHGVPRSVKLMVGTDITTASLTIGVNGTIWILDGDYTNAWRTGSIKGFLIAANGSIVGFDTVNGQVWLKWGNSAWKQASGGSGSYSLPVASADTLGGVKVGAGLRIEDGVLTTISQNTVNITDSLIRSRFSAIYVAYNNSAPSQQVAAIRNILEYEGDDVVKNALKYLANFFMFSLAEYPSSINPLSTNGKDGKEVKDQNGK